MALWGSCRRRQEPGYRGDVFKCLAREEGSPHGVVGSSKCLQFFKRTCQNKTIKNDDDANNNKDRVVTQLYNPSYRKCESFGPVSKYKVKVNRAGTITHLAGRRKIRNVSSKGELPGIPGSSST